MFKGAKNKVVLVVGVVIAWMVAMVPSVAFAAVQSEAVDTATEIGTDMKDTLLATFTSLWPMWLVLAAAFTAFAFVTGMFRVKKKPTG